MASSSVGSNTFTVPDTLQIIVIDKSDTDTYLILPAANVATRMIRFVKIKGNNAFIGRLTPASGTIDGQSYWQSSDNNRAIQIVPNTSANDWMIVAAYND